MPVTTRLVTPADLPALKALCMAIWDASALKPAEVRERLRLLPADRFLTGAYRLVAEDAGVILGFLYLEPSPAAAPEEVRVDALGIDPALTAGRQRAVGLALLRHAFAIYDAAGAKRGVGQVWADVPARRVMQALGATETVVGTDPLTGEPHIIRVEVTLEHLRPRL